MPNSDDYILISGLQHLLFCPRQWGLIHLGREWQENFLTAQGRVMHEKAHSSESENRPGLHIARGLALRSDRLMITGIADVVEFYVDDSGVSVPGLPGTWRPYPVEYKHGRPKTQDCDRVQLCAQAECLEEMLGCHIESGALFYGTPRRREEVIFTPELRAELEELCALAHKLFASGTILAAQYSARCKSCSLIDICRPRDKASVVRYLQREIAEVLNETTA